MSTQDHASPSGNQRDRTAAAGELNELRLCAADAAACDAAFGAEAGAEPGRRQRLDALLSLLGAPTGVEVNRDLMIDLTLARVARSRRSGAGEYAGPAFAGGDLSPEDDDALEALVAAGMDPSQTPGPLRRRCERLAALLGTMSVGKSELGPTNDLVQRTLARVQENVQAEESRLSVAALGGVADSRGGRVRFRLADVVSVAALVLIGFGVLMPVGQAVQGAARRTACEGNLAAAGLGFGLYAGANKDVLPMASASPAGRPWWFVGNGPEQSNSANLYTLVRSGMNKVSDLACGGNARAVFSEARPNATDWGCLEEVSYSYQNMFAVERPRWTGGARVIVLTDRSPVVLKAYNRMVIDPLENSPNHGGRGQAALFNDGAVTWLNSPVLQNGDNVWLPRAIEDVIRQLTRPRAADPLQGTESPAGADDVFVGP